MTNKNKKQGQDMKTILEQEIVYEFINGVPGFPELKKFYIKDLKDGSYPPLMLMTSCDNSSISFILYPHVNDSSLFDQDTLYGFARTYECPQDEVDVYSVVTIRKPNGTIHLTTNLKAPIMLDRSTQKGWQHIIPSQDSDIAYPLDKLSKSLQKAHLRALANPF